MIEPKPAGDQVQRRVDVLVGALQPILNIERALVVEVAEFGLAGEHGVHRTQQPIEVELIPGGGPFLQLGLHGVAGFRPLGADFRERQVAFRQLGAAAIHAVEDVDHDVEGFVLTGHLLDMQIDLRHTEQRAEPADIGADIRHMRRVSRELRDQRAQARVPGLHQARDVDPQRIVLHLHRLVESEGLGPQVKPEPAKGLRVAVEEFRRVPAHNAVERRHALLAIEQQLHDAGRQRPIAPMRRGLRFRRPNQQAAYGMPAIERIETGRGPGRGSRHSLAEIRARPYDHCRCGPGSSKSSCAIPQHQFLVPIDRRLDRFDFLVQIHTLANLLCSYSLRPELCRFPRETGMLFQRRPTPINQTALVFDLVNARQPRRHQRLDPRKPAVIDGRQIARGLTFERETIQKSALGGRRRGRIDVAGDDDALDNDLVTLVLRRPFGRDRDGDAARDRS